MRNAARNTVLVRHTYNLVDLPIKVAGKSGTAEFGTRDGKGRLPFHSWFVGLRAQGPVRTARSTRHDSQLVVLAFAYDSRTKGNAATEIVKYYLQLHFGIKKDYRLPTCSSAATSTRATDGRHPSRTRARHRLGGQVRRRGVARLRPAAHDLRGAAGGHRAGHGLHEQRRERVGGARGRHDVQPRPDVGRASP